VFTVPHELNTVCLANSKWFYGQLFSWVWETLRQFGYTRFGVETGAVCVLHTWGANLGLHPHIHCIVPAVGETVSGNLKHIGNSGKFLYPAGQLSLVFRAKLMESIKGHLKKQSLFEQHRQAVNDAWNKPWVVFCEPSLAKPEHVVRYLGQYTHRVNTLPTSGSSKSMTKAWPFCIKITGTGQNKNLYPWRGLEWSSCAGFANISCHIVL
jgi:hypothetical protein